MAQILSVPWILYNYWSFRCCSLFWSPFNDQLSPSLHSRCRLLESLRVNGDLFSAVVLKTSESDTVNGFLLCCCYSSQILRGPYLEFLDVFLYKSLLTHGQPDVLVYILFRVQIWHRICCSVYLIVVLKTLLKLGWFTCAWDEKGQSWTLRGQCPPLKIVEYRFFFLLALFMCASEWQPHLQYALWELWGCVRNKYHRERR